jgi:NAD(P)-dependent dehydrogenase (short-subunit alcohol dehydrogenase family)
VAEEIRRSGVRALAHEADVSDGTQVQQMFRRAIAELGTADILVTNAGLASATLALFLGVGLPVSHCRKAPAAKSRGR